MQQQASTCIVTKKITPMPRPAIARAALERRHRAGAARIAAQAGSAPDSRVEPAWAPGQHGVHELPHREDRRARLGGHVGAGLSLEQRQELDALHRVQAEVELEVVGRIERRAAP